MHCTLFYMIPQQHHHYYKQSSDNLNGVLQKSPDIPILAKGPHFTESIV